MGSSSRAQAENPSFFKILIEDFETKLEIPPAFVKNFGGVLAGQVKLRTENGTWSVKLDKKKTIFKGHKWVSFIKANPFRKADILLFFLAEDNVFDVMAFGNTSCFFEKKPNISEMKVTPKSSHFEFTFKRFNLFGLFVPAEFALETGMRRRKTVVVRDWKGRDWPVKVGPVSNGEVQLGDGWADFVKGNALKVGSSCLIQTALENDVDDLCLVLLISLM